MANPEKEKKVQKGKCGQIAWISYKIQEEKEQGSQDLQLMKL